MFFVSTSTPGGMPGSSSQVGGLPCSSGTHSSMTAMFCTRRSSRPQELPISIAVFVLSPVNIQILMPAFFRFGSVFVMPSCSLSSTAVQP